MRTNTTAQTDTRLTVRAFADEFKAQVGDHLDSKTIHLLLPRFGLLDDSVTPCRIVDKDKALAVTRKYYPAFEDNPITYETISEQTGKNINFIRDVFKEHMSEMSDGEDYWKGGVFKSHTIQRRSPSFIFSPTGQMKLMAFMQPHHEQEQPQQAELALKSDGEKARLIREIRERLAILETL